MTPFRIVLAGVGGQGVLSAARFLAQALHQAGLPVVAGQLHGMAQRGGSVTATVVTGTASSIVPDGSADVLCAAEPLEALRALPRLRPGGLAVVATRPLVPASLHVRRAGYPDAEAILAAVRARAGAVVTGDATALAVEAGSPQVVNVVLLGMLAGAGGCPVPPEALLAAVEGSCPPSVREINRRAFGLGRGYAARI